MDISNKFIKNNYSFLADKTDNNVVPDGIFQNFKMTIPNDTFIRTTKNENDSKEKTQQQDLQKSKWFTKEVGIVAATGLAVAAALTAVILTKGRNSRRIIEEVNEHAGKIISEASEQADKKVADISSKLDGLLELPANMETLKNRYVQDFSSELSEKLSYNPLEIPDGAKKGIIKPTYLKFTDIDNIPAPKPTEHLSDVISTYDLRNTLETTGQMTLDLPATSFTKAVLSENATIAGKPISNIGQLVDTDMTLAYGQRINWSDEKIARDIIQNFYDGHGHTLDGTKFAVEKLSNGNYKIKISGLSTFDYENLRYIGSGNKSEDLANAGGFGEGAKILVTNLLGKGDTKSVKYGCTDWELIFSGGDNGVMQRLLKKAESPIQGNFIEFETQNKNLVGSIVDSINYFKHSKNPDFSDFTISTPDFGFKFLGENEKGNLYLTQRFEYDQAGKWDEWVDNL